MEFGSKQTTAHPKDGLFLYGPHEKAKRSRDVHIGVVATVDGAKLFKGWLAQIKKRVEVPPPKRGEKQDRLHLANFPGLEEAYGLAVNENELVTCTLDYKVIDEASRTITLAALLTEPDLDILSREQLLGLVIEARRLLRRLVAE